MPAVVGAVKVISIGSSSIFHIGDVYMMQPSSQAKTFAGGGSFNTGNGITIQLDQANTTINDQDQFDQIVSSL
ncbi:spore germination protein [Paraliobacillus ryukyuensis]|uniref:spore germination protein n=1 Tax=Paraliobacillus ryukyuensis TaxID=200904 RepID=UPI0009A8DFA3|nr:spore germination protein [Paraliobacillus ryukyuensis]